MPLREMNREQVWLLPPTLDELVPQDHPARFVAEFVDALGRGDWTELGVEPEGEPLGAPAYHPRALLCVWLYGFMTNVRSCRKLEAACRDQIPYLWLTGWQHPDHNTLWRFYQRHRQSMRGLFKRTVRTAVKMDLLDLAVQAVDGTKLHANAAKNKGKDAGQLREMLDRVEQAIADLESQNERGEDDAPPRLPEKLAEHKALRQRVRQAMEELPKRERPNRYKSTFRINLTDMDARAMRTREGVVPGYNAQAVVSPLVPAGGITGMLVTAVDVVDEANDAARLVPMVDLAEEITETKMPMTLADAGYFSGKHVAEFQRRGPAGGDAGHGQAHRRPLPQGPVRLRPGKRQLHLPPRTEHPFRRLEAQQERYGPAIPDGQTVGVGLLGVSGFRRLHQERTARPRAADQTRRCRLAPASRLDDHQGSPAGLPSPAAPGRAAIRHPQDPDESPAIRSARHGQREGRVDPVCHGLQSKDAVAGLAYPGDHPLET